MGVENKKSRRKEKGFSSKVIGLLQADAGEFTLISYGVGKFGRVLGEVEVTAGNVCDILVEEGHAYSYFGGNKEEARAKAAAILAEHKKVPEKDL